MERVITLPNKPSEPTRVSPRLLVLYSTPKAGKTTLMSTLKNNLILDFESGTDFLNSLSMSIIGLTAPVDESMDSFNARMESNPKKYYLNEAGRAIILAGRPFDFVTIDTASILETLTNQLATETYKSTPIGKNFEGDDVTTLPKGSGYYYTRKSFGDTLARIQKLADNIIVICHVRDAVIEKEGKEMDYKDLDLTGKIKTNLTSEADAVGFLSRGKEGELLIRFKGSDQIVCGSRCNHLKGKVIKIADYDEEKNELVNIDWKAIYPDKDV